MLDIALIHYPVYNKNREIIGSAVTNLDLHDLARAGRTYGVGTVYIVTPFADQQELVKEIVGHWQDGYGATYNKDRKEALAVIEICTDLEELFERVTTARQGRPTILATAAACQGKTRSFQDVRGEVDKGQNFLLLFGTAWGLSEEVFAQVDGSLPPITGTGDYNHLSVRSAVSIMLDRILGQRDL
ncbi:MAG: RNA methyltransferase [Thermodesulfobacteriota bacterium]